jgi:ADP-heptose:LPS heptosyltransferase
VHLVVDLQGVQAGADDAGLRHAWLALLTSLAGAPQAGQVTFLFCGLLPDSIAALSAELAARIADPVVHTWQGIAPVDGDARGADWRREASLQLRAACLASLRPDVVLLTGAAGDGAASPFPIVVPDPRSQDCGQVLAAVRAACRPSQGPASALLNVDRTGIFRPRRLKIVAIKLDHLGDFILSIPALAKLRARYPDADLDIVVGSWNAGFARELQLFRNIHTFDFFKRKSSVKASADDDELAGVLAGLDTYDIAIDLRRQPDSRFFVVRTRAALKAGYQTFDAAIDSQLDVMLRAYRESPHLRTPLNLTPISLQMLRIVDALPADANDYVSLPAIAADTPQVRGRVAIFPKAGTDVREWGRDKLLELADRLLAAPAVTDLQVFFVNGTEAAQYGFVERDRLAVNVGLEFAAMKHLLAGSSLCIANNSGGIHLASYLGVPTIGIYSGHELAREWGPQFHDSVAIHRSASCAPCHLGRKSDCRYDNFCLGDIGVEDVLRKCLEALNGGAAIVTQQGDADIVRSLVAGLGAVLPPDDPQAWLAVATAIAANHPSYTPRGAAAEYHEFVNHVLSFHSDAIEWLGFSSPERDFRWSDGTLATIQFYLDGDVEVPADARVLLVFDTNRRQRIGFSFNGERLRDVVRSGKRNLVSLPVCNLRKGLNRLELELPDAQSPGKGDPRQLGIAVRRLKVVVADASDSVIRRGRGRLQEALLRWVSDP